MLTFYRNALRIRRQQEALGDGALAWNDAPDGVLDFSREPGFRCVLNFSDHEVPLPEKGQVLISTMDLDGRSLPPDAAVWLAD